jgi:hypothetical protein
MSTSAGRMKRGSKSLWIELEPIEHEIEELAHRMRLAGRLDIIVGPLLLQHQPHRLDVIAGEARVALRFEVAEDELVLQSELDAGGAAGDFARDEILTPGAVTRD